MSISIRSHCIPAYDQISRMQKIAPMPAQLLDLEQKTAGGIVKKIKAIIDSEYFKDLPTTAIIQSGGDPAYQWNKAAALKECTRIWEECKEYI